MPPGGWGETGRPQMSWRRRRQLGIEKEASTKASEPVRMPPGPLPPVAKWLRVTPEEVIAWRRRMAAQKNREKITTRRKGGEKSGTADVDGPPGSRSDT